jgi:hypothetical protein
MRSTDSVPSESDLEQRTYVSATSQHSATQPEGIQISYITVRSSTMLVCILYTSRINSNRLTVSLIRGYSNYWL